MKSLIRFTAATETEGCWLGGGRRSQEERQSTLSGEEAQRFYLSLVEEGETAGESRREKRRSGDCLRESSSSRSRSNSHPTSTDSEREGHRLLKCAQEGDLPGLRELLENRGCNVNFQDAYYWTAIMCASYAGQRGAVRLLLHKGAAWVGVVDTQGRDARDLADQAGHTEVVRELESFGVQLDMPGTISSSVSASLPQWCLVCGVQYSESEQKHHSSTLHQFSLQRPPSAPQYCLPPSSAGYRMMLQTGWGPGQGLGPAGAGRKRPIRTVLKRNQGGLGYGPTPQARVTHFKAKDPLAVQRAPRGRTERGGTLDRRAERREEAKDRNWERDFRTSFNLSDL